MGTRSGKQCRERYVNQLDPHIRKSEWTHEEDAIIKKLHHQVGKKWCRFMDQLPGRSDNAIKNRYHIISKNNYADHNRTAARKAFEAEREAPALSAANVPTVFAPETNQVKLERFRSARNLLNEKIKNLLLEQAAEDPRSESQGRNRFSSDKTNSMDAGGDIFRQCSNATTGELDFDFISDLGHSWEDTEPDAASTSASVTASVSTTYDNFKRPMAIPTSASTALPLHAFVDPQKGYSKYLGFPAPAPADRGSAKMDLTLSHSSDGDKTEVVQYSSTHDLNNHSAEFQMNDFWVSDCVTPQESEQSNIASVDFIGK
jgi:hypothetical protein